MGFNYRNVDIKGVYVIILIVFGFADYVKSQSPTFEWVKGIGGGTESVGYSIELDAFGNVYTTGSFMGTVDFDPGLGVFNLTAVGQRDVFISKFDASGNFIWATSFGSPLNDYGISLFVDVSGNIYLTGSFEGTADFDPGNGVFNLTAAGNNDVFVSKFDLMGNFSWAKGIGGFSLDSSSGIVGDGSGNIFTTGYFTGAVDFDPGAGIFTLNATGQRDIFVLKLDASGNFVWVKNFGGPQFDEGYSIVLDGFGNIHVTGIFEGTVDFDTSIGIVNLSSVGGADIFILKLDASGGFLWAKGFGGFSSDTGRGIAVDGSGNVYTTGNFIGTVDFDPGPAIFNLNTPGQQYVYILKLDASGGFVWAKSIQGVGVSSSDSGASIVLDALGNAYITGRFIGTADFDPGPASYTMASLPQGTVNTQSDIYILSLNASGNFLWAKSMGGEGSDESNSVHVDAQGSVYTTGWFQNLVDFDPGIGVFSLTSNGTFDIFIHKLSKCNSSGAPMDITTPKNKSICANSSTTLSVVGTGLVSWFASVGSTIAMASGTTYVTPTLSPGTYTYYAGVNSCTNSVSRTAITITVTSCLGINNVSSLGSEVLIYPNPFSSSATVVFKGSLSENVVLYIYDFFGHLVKVIRADSVDKMIIERGNLVPGLYFFEVNTKSKEIFKGKLVISN